jgi:hypothetical protein
MTRVSVCYLMRRALVTQEDNMDAALTAHSGRSAYEEDGVTWYDAAPGERIAVRLFELRYEWGLCGGRVVSGPSCTDAPSSERRRALRGP